MTTMQVKALQGDTMDSIAYRYFGSDGVAMLPAMLTANPAIDRVILVEHQLVNLPPITASRPSQTLKLWD